MIIPSREDLEATLADLRARPDSPGNREACEKVQHQLDTYDQWATPLLTGGGQP